jgi:hypothetical protein
MRPLSSVEVAIADARLRPLFKLTFYDLDRLDISRRIIRAALLRRGIGIDGLFWVFRGMALALDEIAAEKPVAETSRSGATLSAAGPLQEAAGRFLTSGRASGKVVQRF